MLQNEARQPHFGAYAEDTRNVRSRTPRESTREERDRRHKTLHKGIPRFLLNPLHVQVILFISLL